MQIIKTLFLVTCLSAAVSFHLPQHKESPFTEKDIRNVYERLAVNSGSYEIPPLVILTSPVINAWTDGSSITITTGLLKVMSNKDELAMVFGHEMGHVLAHDIQNELFLDLYKVPMFMDQREREANADKLGAYIMMRAGFDECRGKNIMKIFKNIFGDTAKDEGHPSNAYRMDQLDLPQCHTSLYE